LMADGGTARESSAERARRARTLYAELDEFEAKLDKLDRLATVEELSDAERATAAALERRADDAWREILADRLDRPRDMTGSDRLSWTDLERGLISIPFPCHPHVPAMLRLRLESGADRWEQTCPRCATPWQFERTAGAIDWASIETLRDPEHEQTEPIERWPA